MAKGIDNNSVVEGQSKSDPPISGSGAEIQNYQCVRKKPHNPSTGMGGTRAAISQPEAMATITRTGNPCGLAHPCCSLVTPHTKSKKKSKVQVESNPKSKS